MAPGTGVPVAVGVFVGGVVGVGSGNGVAVGCGVEVGTGVDVDAGAGVGEGSGDEEHAARNMRDRTTVKAVMYACMGISYNEMGSSCEGYDSGDRPADRLWGSS